MNTVVRLLKKYKDAILLGKAHTVDSDLRFASYKPCSLQYDNSNRPQMLDPTLECIQLWLLV